MRTSRSTFTSSLLSTTLHTSGGAVSTQTKANNRWLVLVIACLAQFMVVLDNTIVNVALPSIQKGLHFSPSNLEWVINAYTLIVRWLPAARRSRRGPARAPAAVRRRSRTVRCRLAAQRPGPVLDDADPRPRPPGPRRCLVSPAALSIIITTFQDKGERTRALGVWSAIAAGGAAFGLLLGGILTDLVSWRWNFFVNVPVGS